MGKSRSMEAILPRAARKKVRLYRESDEKGLGDIPPAVMILESA
jgi:hypothetical protein